MQPDLCREYVAEVMRFRRALNLTSVSDPEAFDRRFIRPSLALARYMPDRGRLLDIGSGMGIPGVPLLLACPSLYGVLVERRKKRTEFLRHLIRRLGLAAEAVDADVRDLDSLRVDVCVARAVTREAELLTMCAPHMIEGGIAVLPVPKAAPKAKVPGWSLQDETLLDAFDGDGQLIRCYRYG